MLREVIEDATRQSFAEACLEGKLGTVREFQAKIVIGVPRKKEHGDYASGLALKLAAKAEKSAIDVAELLVPRLDDILEKFATVEVSEQGFINFRLRTESLQEALRNLFEQLDKNHLAIKTQENNWVLQNSKNTDLGSLSKSETLLRYAYTRCCSHLNRGLSPILDFESFEEYPPQVTDSHWQNWQSNYQQSCETFAPLFEDNDDPDFTALNQIVRPLVKQLDLFPDLQIENQKASSKNANSRIMQFALILSEEIEIYFANTVFYCNDEQSIRAKMGLILGCKQVLHYCMSCNDISTAEFL